MMFLRGLTCPSSHLVIPVDFFREKTFYYKVTPWIDHEALTVRQIARLSAKHTYVIMLTTLDALSTLHSILQVHGDVKSDNTLIIKGKKSYVGNVIDFCDCFTFGNPPGSGALACDLSYMSPEALLYAKERDPEKEKELGRRLSGKSDIFSLGLLFHQYWTGEMPEFDKTSFMSVAAAVAAKHPLRVGGPYMPQSVSSLIKLMLSREPELRPDVWWVIRLVKDFYKAQPKTKVEGKILSKL